MTTQKTIHEIRICPLYLYRTQVLVLPEVAERQLLIRPAQHPERHGDVVMVEAGIVQHDRLIAIGW